MQNFLLGSGMMERLLSLGLPRHLSFEFSREVKKYVDNSGPAWTVSRLKSIKLDIIRERAGLPVLSWVRKNRAGGWYGVLGSLRTYAQKNERCFKVVLNALMCYSGFVPDKPTSDHIQKFRSSVMSGQVSLPDNFLSDISHHTNHTGISVKPVRSGDYEPLIQFAGSPKVKAPVFGGPSVPQSQSLEKELEVLKDEGTKHFVRNNWGESYFHVFHGLRRKDVLAGPAPWEEHSPVGEVPLGGKVVPLTKDGGWKVRWIASPYRIHQLALKPLGDRLFGLLNCLPWDCTFDQTKAIPTIQKHLSEGKTAYAVDLSSATDYFPLQLQYEVITKLSYFETWYSQCRLFRDLARARWLSPIGEVRWDRGQPMGLYPSFASFALTHGILLDYLAGHPGRRFFVLGDDVVILDKVLYERYMETLALMECPHEPNKTLESNRITEFAGRIITPNEVIPQFKWKRLSDDNFLDLMRNFGQRFSTQLTRRELAVYDQVASLLPPYGCGHSRGPSIGMQRAVELTDEFEEKCQSNGRRKFYMSFLEFLTHNLEYGKKGSLWNRLQTYAVKRLERAFDGRAQSAMAETAIPKFEGNMTAISDLLEFAGVIPDLPAVVPNRLVKRKSLLETYEGWLGLETRQK